MRARCAVSCAALALALAVPVEATPVELHVARSGRDTWSGRLAAPNRSGTDGPFATLERARAALRAARQGGKARGGATVWVHGGVYTLPRSFVLTAGDGGAPGKPVTYRPYGKEAVRLVGGREVSGWHPVRDAALLARLDPAARRHVLQADLRSQGIVDFGTLQPRGFGRPAYPAALEIFFQDRPMTLARYPNAGWLKITGAPRGQEGGEFTFDAERARRWAAVDDIWVHGYWTFDWADTYERVASLDAASGVVATAPPHGAYGYTPGKRFTFLNVLEELDSPGEWYLDRRSGALLFWPPAPIAQGHPMVSLCEQPLVEVRGASWLTLRGLTLECSRGVGVRIEGGSHVQVAKCLIRNLGNDGVVVNGGTDNGVLGCEITQTGDGGVSLNGGDRATLTPARNYVDDCHIHHYSRWDRTYRPAVGINGVGNRVSHCLIHDAPHNAVLLGGNDHVVEYSDISRVCLETGDAGAFYMGRDYTMRGNQVRYCYFHDIRPEVQAATFVDVMAVYLDDCASGTTVLGNVFYRAGRAAMIGGGRDNVIDNNVFVECKPSIHVDARGIGWASKYIRWGGEWQIFEHWKEMNPTQPPYNRYPHLANLLDDEPGKAKYNRITHNIRLGGLWIDWLDGMSDQTVEVRDNWTEGDPGFVNTARRDFRLRADAPARRLGIRSLPVGQMGLRNGAARR